MLLQRMMRLKTDLAITTSETTTAVIDVQRTSGGMIYVTAGVGLTTLTWYAHDTFNGTYLPAKDGSGNAVTTTIGPSQACLIPAALFGAAYIKAVGNAAATLTISLKA